MKSLYSTTTEGPRQGGDGGEDQGALAKASAFVDARGRTWIDLDDPVLSTPSVCLREVSLRLSLLPIKP